jgi:hypothetical protein
MPVLVAKPPKAPTRTSARVAVGLIAAVVLAAAVALSVVASSVHHVDRLTIVNPYAWDADVDVRAAGSDGWIAVGTVAASTRADFLEVVDLGARWEVRFRSGGRVVTSTVVSRADLAGEAWNVAIPREFSDQATAARLAPSPPPNWRGGR